MKKIFIILLTVLEIIFLNSCNTTQKKSYNEGINIIPTPSEIVVKENSFFKLDKKTKFLANTSEAKTVAEFFVKKIKNSTGYTIPVSMTNSGNIILEINPQATIKDEGYQLIVTVDSVHILAKDAAGLFYGMQTLMQLLPAEIESKTLVKNIDWTIPCVTINDAPRFEYRGMHLDPCRHFATVEFVKKQLDVLALFKINRLHWHLTEDQGWRIEIKKYPLLTEIGAKRIEGEGFEYSGYYTQEEIKEIVAYATEHHITIIPELEVPGHELAAIAAYPELSCKGEAVTPRIIWGVEDIVMCPGKEDMFVFLENVIDELVTLFPSEYYHIGGDECPKSSWKNCPLCQKRIKEEGLNQDKKHSPEEYLQSYVIQRVEKMLAKHGKKIIGWDEILEGGLAPTATVMSWRGESGGIAASLMNHSVIMTPSSGGMYIDHYQGDYKIEPVGIGGYSTLERVYNYNPIPDTLVKMGKTEFIKGVQCNVWSEYLYTPEIREYRIYPRIVALSEIAWSELENKNFENFCKRLDNASVRLDLHDINYHIPQPEQPNGSCNFIAFTDSAVVSFKTSRPIKMVYTVDGSMPKATSKEYTQPFVFKENTTLLICSVLPSGKTSPIRHITIEKQSLAPATEIQNITQGLKMKVTDGTYLNSNQLNQKERDWKESVIKELSEIRSVVKSTESMRGVQQYAAIAEGYINIPEDGVYYFSSNNNEVWINNQLLIDNNDEVKRFSKKDKSIALAKGLHPIKVQFLGHIIGGWPSLWDDGNVLIRKAENTNFEKIGTDWLWN